MREIQHAARTAAIPALGSPLVPFQYICCLLSCEGASFANLSVPEDLEDLKDRLHSKYFASLNECLLCEVAW